MTAAVAEAHGLIEHWIDIDHWPLTRVEAAIEHFGLGPEETDALALYAWAWDKTTHQRSRAHEQAVEALLV